MNEFFFMIRKAALMQLWFFAYYFCPPQRFEL